MGTGDCEAKEAERKEALGRVEVQRFAFTRSERLRKPSDFQRVYSQGKRLATPSLVLFFHHSPSEKTRLGLSVSRKIGKAVARNRVKRVLREAFRLNKHRLKKGYDVLVVARAGVRDMKFHQVEASVMELFGQADLLVQRDNGQQNSRRAEE